MSGASPELIRRLRFSTASLKGMFVRSSETLVRFSISSKISHESLMGDSGQSVQSMEKVTGSVALKVVSASKFSIEAASLPLASPSSEPPELQAARPSRAVAATSAAVRRPARCVTRDARSSFMSLL